MSTTRNYYLTLCLAVLGLVALPASAHVVVKPTEVGVGAFQTFTIGVPVEKEVATVGLRLVVPAGPKYVTPNVKPGWKIQVTKTGAGEEATVTEINWTGGSIPAGQRDEFAFSAQVPAAAAKLQWKAYQTYQDGSVVSWDQAPADHDDEGITPYSETNVINDLRGAGTTENDHTALMVSIVALALSAVAVSQQLRRRQAA